MTFQTAYDGNFSYVIDSLNECKNIIDPETIGIMEIKLYDEMKCNWARKRKGKRMNEITTIDSNSYSAKENFEHYFRIAN